MKEKIKLSQITFILVIIDIILTINVIGAYVINLSSTVNMIQNVIYYLNKVIIIILGLKSLCTNFKEKTRKEKWNDICTILCPIITTVCIILFVYYGGYVESNIFNY